MSIPPQSHAGLEQASQPLAYIAGIGMLTPIGANSVMTATSVKAGINQYAESEYYTDDGRPIIVSAVPDALFSAMDIEIDEGRYYSEQYDHIIKMALCAVQEALSEQTIEQPVPLILAMPEPLPGVEHLDPNLLVKNLIEQGGSPINPERVRTIYTGRAAGIQALELALRYLHEADEDYVLIGGSDSYLSYPRLDALEAERLKIATSKDSFAPGEGAGFLLLSKTPQRALVQSGHVVAFASPGVAEEPGHIQSDVTYSGEGLDQAFKCALAGNNDTTISTLYSSMNGEHYWAKEYGVALLRNKACFKEDYKIEHPADCYGDLGAATAPILMGLAAKDLLKQAGLGSSLVYSSSDSAWRAAVRLQKIPLILNKEAS